MSRHKASTLPQNTCILVTGANSGLGFATCCRLIDDFLDSRPQSHQLTLIFTTRDDKKGNATLVALKKHLSKHRLIRPRLPLSNPRVVFRHETLELTSLLSVRALSDRLLRSAVPRLDAIILNAGIGGFSAINWPLAIWSITSDLVQAATWPTYKLSTTGCITQPQFPSSAENQYHEEPVVGQVFCANVFGHYMLAHWLMPLLQACPESRPARIVWLSSIESQVYHFNNHDVQGLESRTAYEHTKRMTDLMAITATNSPATAKFTQSFFDCATTDRRLTVTSIPPRPTIHLAHPGICATSIVPLPWILNLLMILSFYIARLVGSPWHTVSAYNGAHSPVWLALAEPEEIAEREKLGPAKWGSAVTRAGRESVQRTEIPGWGVCGDGQRVEWWQVGPWWLGGWGRKRGVQDATQEDVERFVEDGALVWQQLERLREQWEGRIERFQARQSGRG